MIPAFDGEQGQYLKMVKLGIEKRCSLLRGIFTRVVRIGSDNLSVYGLRRDDRRSDLRCRECVSGGICGEVQ